MGKYADTMIEVVRIFQGSDGNATRGLYDRLNRVGPVGQVATNLFRANKNSTRAKMYRGRGYKGMAYDRKTWAMTNLTGILTEHAKACGIIWGWGEDPKQEFHRWVLYVDLPTGQVSFHTDARGDGPDYGGDWDGKRGVSHERVCRWCAQLLCPSETPPAMVTPEPEPVTAKRDDEPPADMPTRADWQMELWSHFNRER